MEEFKDLPELNEEEDLTSECYGTPSHLVSKHSKCHACGSHLHFSHSTDFVRNMTLETAKCPECGTKIRRVMHRLQ